MTFSYKVLGQSAPAAGTPDDLYTVPGGKQAIVEGVTICNRSYVATTFRLSVSVAGAATSDQDYLFYDALIDGGVTIDVNAVATMDATDVLRCEGADATLSFNAFGVEIT
jgi:hypothetical protein